MTSFVKLSEVDKKRVETNLAIRRYRYETLVLQGREPSTQMPRAKVILVGDRPGPSAPKDPKYHHTPFYSTKHCSGWLNTLLLEWGINENDLLWMNAADSEGNPTAYKLLEQVEPQKSDPFPKIIALGGKAAAWLKKGGYDEGTYFVKVDHPQYHKRFKNKELYKLPLTISDCIEDPVPDPWFSQIQSQDTCSC